MKSLKLAALTMVAGVLFTALPALAHHSFTAVFDFSKPVTLHGTVVSFELINPHGWVTLDAKKDDGSVERWRIEVSNPNQLLRQGWRKDIFETRRRNHNRCVPCQGRNEHREREIVHAYGRAEAVQPRRAGRPGQSTHQATISKAQDEKGRHATTGGPLRARRNKRGTMMNMQRVLSAWVLTAFVLFAVAATNPVGRTAEEKAQAYNPPTLSDGITPDFRGIWEARGTAYLNIEGHPAIEGVAASKSIIVDPADGKIPYKAEARAKRDENFKNRAAADPENRCAEPGVPRATYLPKPFQIVQSPGNFAIVYEDNHSFQIVYPETKPHFEGIDWWMGDSRGHWDGKTYVVDVTTLNGEAWFDAAGNHHSDNMHVVERFTRTGPDTMQFEARIEDPDTFTQPWTIRMMLYRDTKPGARIAEDECLDDVETQTFHHVSPYDPKNLLKNDYRRWDTKVASVPADSLEAPEPPAPPPVTVAANIPRLPNRHPDLNGLWYKTNAFPTGAGGGRGNGAGRAGRAGRGSDGGAANFFANTPQPGSDASADFREAGVPKVPYNAAGLLEMEWRGSHAFLDGEPRCHLAGVPRERSSHLIHTRSSRTKHYFTIIYEYVHEPRIVPLDGSAHPKGYTAWDGDSRGHWEGDTLVVDVSNFNGRTWLDMSGNFVDEKEHVVERYTMTDPDTIIDEALITDPTIFSLPWTMRMTIKQQPEKDQILEYGCLEGEQDRKHYTEEWGGREKVVVKDGEVQKPTGNFPVATAVAPADEVSINGCLVPYANGTSKVYMLETEAGAERVPVHPGMDGVTQPLLDREVRFWGNWQGDKFERKFSTDRVRVTAEGCAANWK